MIIKIDNDLGQPWQDQKRRGPGKKFFVTLCVVIRKYDDHDERHNGKTEKGKGLQKGFFVFNHHMMPLSNNTMTTQAKGRCLRVLGISVMVIDSMRVAI